MARVCITLACIAVSAALVNAAPAPNNRPIIGILTLPNDIPGYDQYRSYFPASYVKWLESAGARVVPIPFTLDPASLTDLLSNLNGALFTGGGADFTDANGNLTPFAATALAVFNESVTAWQNGETFPLWGTCLGHELISFLASNLNMSTVTSGFDSENLTLPLTFTGAAATSRMYGLLPANINSIFSSQAVTMNNHQSGVTPANFALAPSLANRFTILSTNQDRNGVTFVSSSEGQNGLPVYTTQYHPGECGVHCIWHAVRLLHAWPIPTHVIISLLVCAAIVFTHLCSFLLRLHRL